MDGSVCAMQFPIVNGKFNQILNARIRVSVDFSIVASARARIPLEMPQRVFNSHKFNFLNTNICAESRDARRHLMSVCMRWQPRSNRRADYNNKFTEYPTRFWLAFFIQM